MTQTNTTTTKENAMPTDLDEATTTLITEQLNTRMKAATPQLLALAATLVLNSESAQDPVAVALSLRDYPVPGRLLAAALEGLAETCQDIADHLDDGPAR